ncbi:Hypothetical_protein [Hexamita inflata]|uniref:Hypothetical_protein n=1 Tax=Hexamita inflata TaxID=28002 RepID=A0ABP1HJE4_9EUKA
MNYKSARIMYTYMSYFLLNVINIQFQVLNSMQGQNVKSFNVIYRCIKAFLIGKIIFTLKRETAGKRIERIRSQLILCEVCDYLMFPLTLPFSRFQTAIVEASIMYITCVFSIQTCQNMLEFVGLAIFYMFLVTYIMWYQSNSFAFASVGFSLVFIIMLYYYQESDQKSPITEEVQLKKNSQQLEKVFQKHYSQYIQDVNQEQNKHITTIIASIRINFNPEIERLVQFTRLMEQLCLEYKVSFVTVSSKTFQFFVSEEVSTIQKKFDQALQLCSGAQVIAKCLDMKVSAGVAFGEIEQVKQIFGNLQYKQYYGDALELADFVSQHSFDEILVDATGLYDDTRKPGADHRYGQHFQEPHFAYKTELRKLDFEGETRLIAVAAPRDTMTKQLSDVLIKSGNINDISLNIVIAPSSEPTTDNVTESDSNTATKFIDTRVRYESSQPIIKNSDSPYTEPIHIICPPVQQKANQLEKRSRFAFLKEIQQVMSNQQICSIDQLNIHFSNSLVQNIQPLIPYYFAFGIACALQYQFKVLFSEEMLVQIEIYDQVTLKQWLSRQFVIFAVVGFAELLCVVPYLLFHFGAKIDNVKMKTMKAVDIQIQKLLFAIMALWNLTILYGYQIMLKILKNYPHLKNVCDVAQTSAWTITLYVMHNFNQVINVSSQHPLYIYRNLKVFTVMELVHWLMVFRQFPVMAALMLFMQVQQLPVQLQVLRGREEHLPPKRHSRERQKADPDPEPPPDAAPGEQRAPAADEEPADPPAGHRGRPDGEVREAEDGAGHRERRRDDLYDLPEREAEAPAGGGAGGAPEQLRALPAGVRLRVGGEDERGAGGGLPELRRPTPPAVAPGLTKVHQLGLLQGVRHQGRPLPPRSVRAALPLPAAPKARTRRREAGGGRRKRRHALLRRRALRRGGRGRRRAPGLPQQRRQGEGLQEVLGVVQTARGGKRWELSHQVPEEVHRLRRPSRNVEVILLQISIHNDLLFCNFFGVLITRMIYQNTTAHMYRIEYF